MRNINLLSKDLTPKKTFIKLSNTVKKVSIIGFSAIIIAIIALTISLIFISRRINQIEQNQQQLRTTITSLEQTEQKLVLIRDRIEKAQKIEESKVIFKEVDRFSQLYPLIPEGVLVKGTNFSSEDTQVSLLIDSSSTLTELFAKLLSSDIYNFVRIQNFSFKKDKGFTVSLSFKG